MKLIAYGLNHKTAPLAVREQLGAPDALAEVLIDFRNSLQVKEAVVLYTCNRTELYCVQSDEQAILQWLSQRHSIPVAQLQQHCYVHNEQAAVRHIMRVASGLDSMVIGEQQIMGQLKQAYQTATDTGTIGPQLERVFQHVFIAGKKVRSKTEIGRHPVSIAYSAVDLAKKIFADFSTKTVMLIGAGDTIELAARHLQTQGINKFIIANRSKARAAYLAQQFAAQIITLGEIPQYLAASDLIISATASQLPILGKGMLERVTKTRKRRPMLLIDLAVPRDIEPEVAELPDVFLYNIDDLQTIIVQNYGKREQATVHAEQIIEAELASYIKWRRSLRAVKAIRLYREKMFEYQQQELQIAQQELLAGVDATAVLKEFSRRLTNKLIHQPTRQLRKAGYDGRDDLLQLAEQMFE